MGTRTALSSSLGVLSGTCVGTRDRGAVVVGGNSRIAVSNPPRSNGSLGMGLRALISSAMFLKFDVSSDTW